MLETPLLSLEDHFVSSVCQEDNVAKTLDLQQFPTNILQKLTEVGPYRIGEMKQGNVQLQVVSHIPVVISVDECKKTNDELHQRVESHHPKFAAFATLPMGDPAHIAAELERCVKDLGFAGALIPNHSNGRYYDGEEYLPMWQSAESLNVPIYLHPCPPSSQAVPYFQGNYTDDAAFAISTHAWDWHSSCGMHFVRLYSSGLFDKCSRLKLILGHLGEMVPFMLGRVERKLALTRDSKSWQHTFRDVYARNVWVTTSGMFDIEQFRLILSTTAMDRIMFSVDYPFESTVQSMDFMSSIKESGLVSEKDFAKIAYKNAEELLNVKVDA